MRIRTSLLEQIRTGLVIAAVGSAAVMTVAMFMGWFVTGTRVRNSFEMFRIPQQLGLEGFTTIRVVWFILPVLAAGVVGFMLLGRQRFGGALLFVHAVASLTVGTIVMFSPIHAGGGPLVAILGGVAGLISGIGLLVLGKQVHGQS